MKRNIEKLVLQLLEWFFYGFMGFIFVASGTYIIALLWNFPWIVLGAVVIVAFGYVLDKMSLI